MSASSFPAPGARRGAERNDRLAPILACGALSIMLIVQLLLPPSAPPSEPPGLAPRRQRPVTVPPVPEYAAILVSPIFAPDRRPGASGDGSGSGAGSLIGYAALGVAVGRADATAVITVPGGGIKTMRRGDEVEGWRLVAVDRTRVFFERDGVRHALVIGAPPEEAPQPAGPGPNPNPNQNQNQNQQASPADNPDLNPSAARP